MIENIISIILVIVKFVFSMFLIIGGCLFIYMAFHIQGTDEQFTFLFKSGVAIILLGITFQFIPAYRQFRPTSNSQSDLAM